MSTQRRVPASRAAASAGADVQTRLQDIEAEMESIDTKLASMASLLDEVTRVSVSRAMHLCSVMG